MMFKFLKILIFIISALLFNSHAHVIGASSSYLPLSTSTARLTFSGVGTHGIFDTSLTYDPASSRLWMGYSAINPSVMWAPQNPDTVSNRLAYSDDNGNTWTDFGATINPTLDVTVATAAPNNAGTWHNEVSNLFYDPGANPSERWKLMWEHYLYLNGTHQIEHSWIALKSASSPSGLVTAPEVKLFGASLYNSVNDTQNNAFNQSPLGGPPEIMLNTLHSDLNSCVIFTEPGLYATNSSLYMTLLCSEFPTPNNRIFLLRCDSPCDMTQSGNWSYVGTLFETSDAVSLGHEKFSAPEIFESGGRQFVMVSPVSQSPVENAYNGCLVFQFSDIDNGTLVGGSTPDTLTTITGSLNSFNGACSYHEEANGSGFIYSEIFFSETDKFRLFMTGNALPVASNNVSQVKAFPNPLRPHLGQTEMQFVDLPSEATLKIYTLNGVLVKELKADSLGTALWTGQNKNGENVVSGVYFCLVEGSGGPEVLKIAIER